LVRPTVVRKLHPRGQVVVRPLLPRVAGLQPQRGFLPQNWIAATLDSGRNHRANVQLTGLIYEQVCHGKFTSLGGLKEIGLFPKNSTQVSVFEEKIYYL
jgi:hypothetical protein